MKGSAFGRGEPARLPARMSGQLNKLPKANRSDSDVNNDFSLASEKTSGLDFLQFFGLDKEDLDAFVGELLFYGLDYRLNLGRVLFFNIGE